EILDQHVGCRDQLRRDRQFIGLLEMQRDAALTAVPGGVGRCIPQRSARRINADDIGPLISQQHGSERSCDVLAKIDDPNAVEYPGHTFPPSWAAQATWNLYSAIRGYLFPLRLSTTLP